MIETLSDICQLFALGELVHFCTSSPEISLSQILLLVSWQRIDISLSQSFSPLDFSTHLSWWWSMHCACDLHIVAIPVQMRVTFLPDTYIGNLFALVFISLLFCQFHCQLICTYFHLFRYSLLFCQIHCELIWFLSEVVYFSVIYIVSLFSLVFNFLIFILLCVDKCLLLLNFWLVLEKAKISKYLSVSVAAWKFQLACTTTWFENAILPVPIWLKSSLSKFCLKKFTWTSRTILLLDDLTIKLN